MKNNEYEAALQAEQGVLGALMLDSEKIDIIRAILEEDDFFDERNKELYRAIIKLNNENIEIDHATIFSEVYNKGAFKSTDASLYIVEVYEITPTSKNVVHYANIVRKNSIKREVKAILTDSMKKMNDGMVELDDIVSFVMLQIEKATERAKTNNFKEIQDVTREVFDEIIAKMSGEGKNIAISTGFSSLDGLLSGFSKGDLIILAARPSMGKTAFALNIALNVAGRSKKEEEKKTVALFSLEMGAEQIVTRMLCSEGMIDSKKTS